MVLLVSAMLLAGVFLMVLAVKGQADLEAEKIKYEHSLHANQ
jgi:hypothetical protein